MNVPSKPEWRTRVLGDRRRLAAGLREAENATLISSVTTAVTRLANGRTGTVCAYVPVGSEPGSVGMLESLRAAGWRVLVPVTGESGPLDWAEFTGLDDLVPADYGLREPGGPALPPSTIADALVVLVPALAVDHSGVRLGRGAGFYDRTLGLAAPGTALVAVVRDAELVPTLPADPHDVAMTHALTPGRGLVRLTGADSPPE